MAHNCQVLGEILPTMIHVTKFIMHHLHSAYNWTIPLKRLRSLCYASTFRRRRHYVFGLSVRPSEAWNTLFWPVHESVGPPDQPWPFYGMSVRPSVRPSVCPSVRPSVRPSGEVSGHLPENAWREWREILHADVSCPPPELISLWPRSVDFSNFGTIST